MSAFDSFQPFEEKFGPGRRYADVPAGVLATLRRESFPAYYVSYLEQHGLQEFRDGFWWFVNPLELREELAPFAGTAEGYPIIRNAFGCYLVRLKGQYHHLNIHTRNFPALGNEDALGLIFNFTLTDDYALRDMFFGQYFEPALERLGKVAADEIYAFAPALALGGEIRDENVERMKLREHLHFLAQI